MVQLEARERGTLTFTVSGEHAGEAVYVQTTVAEAAQLELAAQLYVTLAETLGEGEASRRIVCRVAELMPALKGAASP